MTADALPNQPVVLDNGSGICKAGFAGEEAPKCYFPACVGRPKHHKAMAGAVEGDTFIGKRAQELRGLLRLSYPLEHGVVTNWEEMELIWHHVYTHELKTEAEEHPVLFTEAPLNPRTNREDAAQILFESFNVPALFFALQAVLALYASGRTTGLVLDSGDGVSHVVPVYEGFSMQHAIRRTDVAGRDVTEELQRQLMKSGYAFRTSAEKEIVRHIKETHCYLALSPREEEANSLHGAGLGTASQPPPTYTLPDGTTLKLGTERYMAPEILFHPHLVGMEDKGVHELIADAISRVDMDLRKVLYGNIVLSGGSTCFHRYGDKLLHELKGIARDQKIKIYAPPERKYSTWIGGSILASLSTFKKMWVGAEEYQEYGPNILFRKF